MKFLFCVVLLALTLLAPPVFAEDEVLRTVDEAVSQYKKGDFAGAASNLDYASQLIRQKKSEEMKSLLPEPLAGWIAEPALSIPSRTALSGHFKPRHPQACARASTTRESWHTPI